MISNMLPLCASSVSASVVSTGSSGTLSFVTLPEGVFLGRPFGLPESFFLDEGDLKQQIR